MQSPYAKLLKLARSRPRRFDRRDPVAVGALVDVWTTGERGDEAQTFFLLPTGDQVALSLADDADAEAVRVATPDSPWGQALLGRRAGELVSPPGEPRPWMVLEVE